LADENITKCLNLAVGENYNDSAMIYIVCKGLADDATFETTEEQILYIIVVTNVTGNNKIRYISHYKIDMGNNKISNQIDIFANYDPSKNEDIITVSNSGSNGDYDLQAYTARFNATTKLWTPNNFGVFISKENGNILNYPVVQEQGTSTKLHSVFEDNNQIYIVTTKEPTTQTNQNPGVNYYVTPCGIPKEIEYKNSKEETVKGTGLECLEDSVQFLNIVSDKYVPIFFASTEEHSLTKDGKGEDFVAFYPGGITAFNIVVEEKKA
jgi:hypothetical protein